jgi:hypothetical protein
MPSRRARGWIDRCSHRSASEREPGAPISLAFDRQVGVDRLDLGCRHAVRKWFSAFRASAISPTDIEHDLVVIPGIIKRRDIDLSPPVGEWPLFAHSGRLESTYTDLSIRLPAMILSYWSLYHLLPNPSLLSRLAATICKESGPARITQVIAQLGNYPVTMNLNCRTAPEKRTRILTKIASAAGTWMRILNKTGPQHTL